MNEANGSDVCFMSSIFNAVQVTGTIKIGHSLTVSDNDMSTQLVNFGYSIASRTTFCKIHRSNVINYHQRFN